MCWQNKSPDLPCSGVRSTALPRTSCQCQKRRREDTRQDARTAPDSCQSTPVCRPCARASASAWHLLRNVRSRESEVREVRQQMRQATDEPGASEDLEFGKRGLRRPFFDEERTRGEGLKSVYTCNGRLRFLSISSQLKTARLQDHPYSTTCPPTFSEMLSSDAWRCMKGWAATRQEATYVAVPCHGI